MSIKPYKLYHISDAVGYILANDDEIPDVATMTAEELATSRFALKFRRWTPLRGHACRYVATPDGYKVLICGNSIWLEYKPRQFRNIPNCIAKSTEHRGYTIVDLDRDLLWLAAEGGKFYKFRGQTWSEYEEVRVRGIEYRLDKTRDLSLQGRLRQYTIDEEYAFGLVVRNTERPEAGDVLTLAANREISLDLGKLAKKVNMAIDLHYPFTYSTSFRLKGAKVQMIWSRRCGEKFYITTVDKDGCWAGTYVLRCYEDGDKLTQRSRFAKRA